MTTYRIAGQLHQLEFLDVRDRKRWRAWLAKNHVKSTGVWLVYHKSHTGIPALSLDDSISEALCFGWIDSLIRRVDDRRYVRKFTLRRPKSTWSAANRKTWRGLKAAGLLAPAGLANAPTAQRPPPRPAIPELPGYLSRALRAKPKAWQAFRALAPSRRREYVTWIHVAVKDETRARRIREVIALLTTGKRLGLR